MRNNVKQPAPIVFVAPFSPVGSGPIPSLGAAKKIISVVAALSSFGREIVFVNSAHNSTRFSKSKLERVELRPGLLVTMLTPPTVPSRPLGKLLNFCAASSLATYVFNGLCGNEAGLLWIYNGYAFESRFALTFLRLAGCPLVIEMEDMPYSRPRPANFKPWLDSVYLKRALPKADLVTCVNKSMPATLGLPDSRSSILSGLVNNSRTTGQKFREIFSRNVHALGYFGGLTREKGAHYLLELVPSLPDDWRLVVTGAGPLWREFETISAMHPEKLRFLREASDDEVVSAIEDCDAIINPHSSIAEMGDGIFPFKVVEAIASGRLVISTPLPATDFDISGTVMFFEPGIEDIRGTLLRAKDFFFSRKDAILDSAAAISARYSEFALSERIRGKFFSSGLQ